MTESGAFHASALQATYSIWSTCVPAVVCIFPLRARKSATRMRSPGARTPIHPKLTVEKSSAASRAHRSTYFSIAARVYSGANTSNAFPRANMCQPQWLFCAVSAAMTRVLTFSHTRRWANGT